jgi:hypothetical protein
VAEHYAQDLRGCRVAGDDADAVAGELRDAVKLVGCGDLGAGFVVLVGVVLGIRVRRLVDVLIGRLVARLGGGDLGACLVGVLSGLS